MSKNEIIQKVEYTEDEKVMLERESRNVVEQILKEMNQKDNEVH